MNLQPGSERIFSDGDTDPLDGVVRWAPAKSLWLGTMTAIAIAAAPFCFSWSALALFLVTSAITLCFGHSVGMHRRLIHSSFDCPLWLEHLCVYLGTLVGMAGPYGMVRLHDFRDWAQRQPRCHDYSRHNAGFWQDAWWQLNCELVLDASPDIRIEPRIAEDRFYQFLERTWMLQHIPWALLCFACGGWGFVFWGVCARVSTGVFGHWLIGYLAHNHGELKHEVRGAAVQGRNVRLTSLLTMGECWHNNHHAHPVSARHGLAWYELDINYYGIWAMEKLGLAKKVQIAKFDHANPKPAGA